MGAWDVGAFDNDLAADWVGDFEGYDLASGLQAIRLALTSVVGTEAGGFVDADDAAVAVGAAELVAAINGRPAEATAYDQAARDWIDRSRPAADPGLTDLARTALSRVVGEGSELAELWEESGPSWRTGIATLRAKLGG
jgi:hypothetical protein